MDNPKIPTQKVRVSDVLLQLVFLLVAAFIIFHFFWTLSGLWISFISSDSGSNTGSQFTFAALALVVISNIWWFRSFPRNKKWAPMGSPDRRDLLLFIYFGYNQGMNVTRWLYVIFVFALADKLLVQQWSAAAIAVFGILCAALYQERLKMIGKEHANPQSPKG